MEHLTLDREQSVPEDTIRRDHDVTIRLGAAAGDGVQSAGEILTKVLSRSGLYIATYNGNQSLIRGGHVWFHIHAGEERVYSLGYGIDILVALTQAAWDEHRDSLNKGGAVIYDSSAVHVDHAPEDVKVLDLPLLKTALKYDKRPIMKNTVAIGAACALLGLDLNTVNSVIAEQFARKPDVQQSNVKASTDGYGLVAQAGKIKQLNFNYSQKRMFMHADYALAAGAVAAGCRFYAAYPMSPASPIVHWMTANAKKFGIRVFLGEDEIAVANATIGASYAGARAMCATSGGGFSLMQEAIGQAAMTETPLVVVDVMRAGPSTGLPTKTSQGDLNMVLGISHDDFPRAVIAPSNPENSFYTAGRAFNLAEKYQLPVIVLLDFAIGDGGYATVEHPDFNLLIQRGEVVREARPGELNGVWFKRYGVTASGISPRAYPGTEGLTYVAKTDEHDEWGHDLSDVFAGLKEAVAMRKTMHEKRMRKMQNLADEMRPPNLFGPDVADMTVVTWGSSAMPVREALPVLWEKGFKVNSLEFEDVYPLNPEVGSVLKGCADLFVVEQNYTGQFAKLIRRETGIDIVKRYLKYDGEPIYPSEVVNALLQSMAKGSVIRVA
ncbi:MAG: 2-oxoacid:acceptor oxidoreductase subunit alpha [Thermoprotei archaeon]